MSDKADNAILVPASGTGLSYEPPRLTPLGTLSDLLAGVGTNPCDGMSIQAGPDPASGPIGSPSQCGPE
jgi:hypothetical protein